jgi:hypothetical protein
MMEANVMTSAFILFPLPVRIANGGFPRWFPRDYVVSAFRSATSVQYHRIEYRDTAWSRGTSAALLT